jgi:hypothetical protein
MQEFEWIDDCFRVEKQRWGTWRSYDKDGNGIITSLHENQCIESTRWYLKEKQDGFSESSVKYEGVVGGKL